MSSKGMDLQSLHHQNNVHLEAKHDHQVIHTCQHTESGVIGRLGFLVSNQNK